MKKKVEFDDDDDIITFSFRIPFVSPNIRGISLYSKSEMPEFHEISRFELLKIKERPQIHTYGKTQIRIPTQSDQKLYFFLVDSQKI